MESTGLSNMLTYPTNGTWNQYQQSKQLQGTVFDPSYVSPDSVQSVLKNGVTLDTPTVPKIDNNAGGLGDWFGSGNGQAMMSAGLGVGNLGLGLASYLENKKTADKQRQLMDQQISNNKFVLSEAKGRQADIARTFG